MGKPLTSEEIELLRQAADEGKVCGRCGRALDRDEAIYRERWYRDILYYGRCGAVPICAGCVGVSKDWFHYAGPCDVCSRPVHEETFRARRWTICHTHVERHLNQDSAKIIAAINVNQSSAPLVVLSSCLVAGVQPPAGMHVGSGSTAFAMRERA